VMEAAVRGSWRWQGARAGRPRRLDAVAVAGSAAAGRGSGGRQTGGASLWDGEHLRGRWLGMPWPWCSCDVYSMLGLLFDVLIYLILGGWHASVCVRHLGSCAEA
jgi:hypothetical protein